MPQTRDQFDSLSNALSQVSMVSANFGNASVFESVLADWVQFLGGRPREVVIVDGGSKPETHDLYWKLFK
jgi:hypothetical protein